MKYNTIPIITECNTIVKPLSIVYYTIRKLLYLAKEQLYTLSYRVSTDITLHHLFFTAIITESMPAWRQRILDRILKTDSTQGLSLCRLKDPEKLHRLSQKEKFLIQFHKIIIIIFNLVIFIDRIQITLN